jgi:hypothetical protein
LLSPSVVEPVDDDDDDEKNDDDDKDEEVVVDTSGFPFAFVPLIAHTKTAYSSVLDSWSSLAITGILNFKKKCKRY